jgi:acetyl esterase/lipase
MGQKSFVKRTLSAAFLIAALLTPVGATAGSPIVLNLWPGRPPGDLPDRGPEKTYVSDSPIYGSNVLTTNVTNPTISVYLPVRGDNTCTAVVICPGGGYWDLYMESEGEQIASWLNFNGMTGVVLKYRVPRPPSVPEADTPIGPQMDAQRAVSTVRSMAGKWGINPNRIGILGFSAGGHLAIATATNFSKRTYEPVDSVDKVSSRPDFAVLCYSGYLKEHQKKEATSLNVWPGLQIPSDTPPVFLVHATDDTMSPSDNSVIMYLALKKAGIPAELHIYARGEHDFGVRQDGNLPESWPQLCIRWLQEFKMLEKRP